MIVLYNSLLFLTLLRFCNSYHYSNFSFLWIIYLFLSQDRNLIPFVVSNHIATINCWYSSWLLDNSIPLKLIVKNNWHPLKFILGDLILHFLPMVYLINILNTTPLQFDKSISYVRYCGLYSLLIHLLWGFSLTNSFDISGLYLELSTITTNTIWIVLTLSHTISMFFFCFYIV